MNPKSINTPSNHQKKTLMTKQTDISKYFIKSAPAVIGTLLEMAKKTKNNNYKKGKSKLSKKTTKKYKPRYKNKYNKTRPSRKNFRKYINVKADVDGRSRTYYKQKVTKKQQKRINYAMKSGFSPFVYKEEEGVQETIPQNTNRAKYIWRCHNALKYISKQFTTTPPSGLETVNSDYSSTGTYVANGPDVQLYFSDFVTRYEILNPTNYDMNLIIYDVVCKADTPYNTTNKIATYDNDTSSTTSSTPIDLMKRNLTSISVDVPEDESSTLGVGVSDYTNTDLFDIQYKPTSSYAFNIHWTVVGKKYIKLQPGASHYHIFTHKAKALMSRGYWGYKYYNLLGDETANNSNIGVANITSGTLFKFWGGVAGTSDSSRNPTIGNMGQIQSQVLNLSGRLMFKEFFQGKWYRIDPKLTYVYDRYINRYTPGDEETLSIPTEVKFENPNDEKDDLDDGEED